MKPLNLTENSSSMNIKYDVIPAQLHDVSGQVHNDNLFSLYTISSEVDNTDINVSIIASDLVRHTAGNGAVGYWVGIGINQEILQGSSVYLGWGESNDSENTQPVFPDGEQKYEDSLYGTFYFNSENAENYNNKAYIVVDNNGVHYHYNLDFSLVSRKVVEEKVEEITWTSTTVQNLKDNYLFGINLADPSGNPLPEGLYSHYMNASIDYIQSLLDITISETEFTGERHDYIRNDYQNWGFIQLSHNPVKYIKGLRLTYGNRPSVEIPLDWIQLDKLTGQITLFPSSGSANSLIIGQTGMLFGFQSQWDYAPQLWEVDYVAGVDEKDPSLPVGLLTEAIYKRCACGVLNVWGDLIIGAGIASQSVSIDGISQSIGTTQSAMFGGASARVQEYTNDLNDRLLPALRQKFGGLRMIVV